MLQWIRRSRTKKHFKIFMIIGIAVLSLGLIGSYAIWSIPRFSSSSGTGEQTPADPTVEYQQMEERIAELEKSLSQKKDDPALLEKLGNAYYDLGFQMFMDGTDSKAAQENMNAALKNYEAVLKLKPDNIPVVLQAAYTASIVGNISKAEELYQKALSLDAGSIEVKLNYGHFLLYGKNDFDGARKQWNEALKLNPDAETKKNIESLIEQANQLQEYQKKQTKDSGKEKSED